MRIQKEFSKFCASTIIDLAHATQVAYPPVLTHDDFMRFSHDQSWLSVMLHNKPFNVAATPITSVRQLVYPLC